MNEFMTFLTTYVPVLGPPLAVAIAWIVTETRKSKKEDEKDTSERERTYSDRLENRLKEREADIERLSKEIMALRDNLSPEDVIKSLIDNDPGISWAKRRSANGVFVMVRVSSGYAKVLLKGAPEDYDGKRDSEMWSAVQAESFAKNDELVHTRQEGLHVEEAVGNGKFIGRKFPVHIRGNNYVVGIGNYEPNN